MFVIGRNVEVKVERGRLTIRCQTDPDVIPGIWTLGKHVIAQSYGRLKIPTTDFYLVLTLYRDKQKIQ